MSLIISGVTPDSRFICYRTKLDGEEAKLNLEFFMEYIKELSRLLGNRVLECIMESQK